MTSKTLAAHTSPGLPYPPFVNISLDGDGVIFTVRGPVKITGRDRKNPIVYPGETASACVSREEGVAILVEALAKLREACS